MTYAIRDVVTIETGRFQGDYAVRSFRYISKGRNAGKCEYELAPMQPRDGTIGVTVYGDTLLVKCRIAYATVEVDAALNAYNTKSAVKEQHIEKRTATRQKVVGQMDVQPGDIVTIRGTTSAWTAEVGEVNTATGKIGIRKSYSEVRRATQRAYYAQQLGMRGVVRELRWIPQGVVLRVTRNGAQIWPSQEEEATFAAGES